MLVYKDADGKIHTSLYTKPTDSQMYLHYTSYHPKHQKQSIPYSQAVRLRRICSNDTTYKTCAIQLLNNLRARGYPLQLVLNAISKASKLNRSEVLHKERTANKQQIIPLIITFTLLTQRHNLFLTTTGQ